MKSLSLPPSHKHTHTLATCSSTRSSSMSSSVAQNLNMRENTPCCHWVFSSISPCDVAFDIGSLLMAAVTCSWSLTRRRSHILRQWAPRPLHLLASLFVPLYLVAAAWMPHHLQSSIDTEVHMLSYSDLQLNLKPAIFKMLPCKVTYFSLQRILQLNVISYHF